MKRLLVTILVLGFLASSAAFADYNRDVAVRAMRDNFAAFGKLRAAAGSGDFSVAADSFMTIANGSLKLLAMDPPKGQKAVWEEINRDMVKAALRGVEAAVDKDKAGVDAALAAVSEAQKKGHASFR